MKFNSLPIVVRIYILAICATIFFNVVPVFWENCNFHPNDYARITDVDYKAVVVDETGSQGKIVVTERLTFDVHAASKDNLFWELWRDLPESYVDGVKVDYKVNSVKEILADGTEVIYDESPKLYWYDNDYVSSTYGPGKWYHSEGPYDEEAAQYECVLFYVDGLYREEVVFEIEYEMRNAALKYNDCSDLYISLYSGDTIKYLDSFKAQILLENKDMPRHGNYDTFSYGTNSNVFPIEESATMNPGYYTFYFELDKNDLKFRPYNQYIEFDLISFGQDKHRFTAYASTNDYTYDNVLDEIYEAQEEYASTPAKYESFKILVFILLVGGSILLLAYTFTAQSRIRKKHTFYHPTLEMDYYRDIPSDLDPNFASALVFCKNKTPKDDSGIYSAILLSLVRKEYIELRQQGIDDVLITIKERQSTMAGQQTLSQIGADVSGKTYEPLTPSEEYYYNLLVRHAPNKTILMSKFQHRIANDYNNTNAFVNNIKKAVTNIGVKDGYFQKADYTQPRKKMRAAIKPLWVIGIILIVFVNVFSYRTRMDFAFGAYSILGISCIISAIYLNKISRKYVLLTQMGENEYAKWRGLYHFLNSNTLIHERTVIELPLWEKYLVYATAFGLSEKVIEAIRIRCPEVADSPILSNNYCCSRSFHSSGRSFRSAVRSGSTGGGYSGGGGGFGYGGGGRGGGGGGGGH